ncbi:Uncharacterized [Syntrophomonas zehnderi OL-4]|uniref:Uncharacterized n=1 Tax=Syntrophomonas zehnderi OL-4 TaxID=690567 RepID=A0A0E3W2R6_9FIRM|nr:DUF5710 domain-containing protein [Syntrophomonas zehnderi]CFX15807.1 Uncharacterized [Syntrophomonas zehnderi OL-4]
MTLYLNVPYSEKDEAKTLGAKWNPELRMWYVENKYDYYKFAKWRKFSNTSVIICDYLLIVKSKRSCFRCQTETPVISLATGNYVPIENPKVNQDKIILIDAPKNMPDPLHFYLKKAFNFYYGFSNFIQDWYFANHCVHCGNNYLYEEPSGPFYFYPKSKIKDLSFYSIKLQSDLELSGFLTFGNTGTILKSECSEFIELDVKI